MGYGYLVIGSNAKTNLYKWNMHRSHQIVIDWEYDWITKQQHKLHR